MTNFDNKTVQEDNGTDILCWCYDNDDDDDDEDDDDDNDY